MIRDRLEIRPISVSGQQQCCGQTFPLVLACQTPTANLQDVTCWMRSNRELLQQTAAEHGVVLFRGFPLESAADFDVFVTAFGLPNFPYEQSLSNAVRISRTERVFTANEAPSHVSIYLHHEMAQTPVFPGSLFFFCEQPADEGGATPVCRSDVLLARLTERAKPFVDACVEKGLKYTNVMPGENDSASGMGRSWQSTFRAESRGRAEQRMRELGYTWQWQADGSLRATTPVLPAVLTLRSGRKTFFNQLIAATQGWKDSRNDPSKSITLGDGSPLDNDSVLLAAGLADGLTYDVAWQRGDVALVDNYLAMHGRRPFAGPRKVLASLAAPQSHGST